MKKLMLIILIFAGTQTYGQKWEVGIGIGVENFRNTSEPPYTSYSQGNSINHFPAFSTSIKYNQKRFNFALRIGYYQHVANSLDTMKVPVRDQYPINYKDSMAFANSWKTNYYQVKIDCDYKLFTIKKLQGYGGIGVGYYFSKTYFNQNQLILDNNNKSIYNLTENGQDFFVSANYQMTYKISKNINIENVLGSSIILTDSYGRKPIIILSDYFSVGYVF